MCTQFLYEFKLRGGVIILIKDCNGTLMLSSESEVVRNSAALSGLEEFLRSLSPKYGLGELLFMERNPSNNNSTDAFYLRAPSNWSLDKLFDVWYSVLDESNVFIEKHGFSEELMLCGISVTQRY